MFVIIAHRDMPTELPFLFFIEFRKESALQTRVGGKLVLQETAKQAENPDSSCVNRVLRAGFCGFDQWITAL